MTVKIQNPDADLAILYSFRRCPYAMRARMALQYSGVKVNLREVELKNKPQQLLQYSAKGTVPVLVLTGGFIIDESRDIMYWALAKNDPDNWIPRANIEEARNQIDRLLDENDFNFKSWLDRYKYSDRYPEQTAEYYRHQGEQFLASLEFRLSKHRFLMGDNISMADIGIFPFIRQFAFVDKDWFYQSDYPYLHAWLDYFLQSELFNRIMKKYPAWTEVSAPIILGDCGKTS
ncbi:glutathione S-transferase [Bathymodiolus japonicus methanotrophic gill symbiont]|uniref:glutathione S-transferase n=1 Tax=Bathymodiolus japonicus methanotrophic gill symbiont TaxID=113269 RepID=UPI001B628D23|nr:glutathione S-transferase [Bathymodiolus japonicus methanotrophic gill symbiont]GFO71256.1 glutathione S-transferase [Bathymodiolus japonicus methanotrophic gill symbiont]